MEQLSSAILAAAAMSGYDHPGSRLDRAVRTRDGRTVDTSGGFLVGELERLDQTLHEPLASVTWDRDLPLRTDVTVGDEVSSFTQSTFSTPSGPGNGAPVGQKRSFIGKDTTQLPTMAVDIDKVTVPLTPWGLGVSYSLPELASAAQLGRPIDQQKVVALNMEYQLQTDAQAYFGSTMIPNSYGLLNHPNFTVTNIPGNGTGSSPNWSTKTAAQILADLATMVYTPWAASGFAVRPNRVALDPDNFNLIQMTPATTAGSKSILQFFLESYNSNPGVEKLQVLPLKWCIGAGAGGTLMQAGTVNRAVVYNRFEGPWQNAWVRFPTTMLQRTPVQYNGLFHSFFYWGRMGSMEAVYPETVALFDGL